MSPAEPTGVQLLTLKSDLERFLCLSSTRHGGLSGQNFHSLNLGLHVQDDIQQVLANRSLLAQAIGIQTDQMVWMNQIHSNKVRKVSKADRGAGSRSLETAIADCDAMICPDAGVFLTVGQADCLAVVAVDSVKKGFGVAHAGWKGCLEKTALEMIKAMQSSFDSRLSDLEIVLSPAICQNHLELGLAQEESFKETFAQTSSFIRPGKPGKIHLDMWACVQYQLVEYGCDPNQITSHKRCTYEEEQNFFSYRRGPQNCGRMVTLAGFLE